MRTGVAKIAAEKRERVLEQVAAGFPFGFHGSEEIIEATHNSAFDLEQLFDALGIPSMMREIVVLGFHAIDLRHTMVVLNDDADHARGIGLYNQWNKIE